MLKIRLLSIVALMLPVLVFGQTKMLSLEDCVINRDLYPDNLPQLQWQGGTDLYTYVDAESDALVQGKVAGDEKEILTLGELNDKLPQGVDKLKGFPQISWSDDNTFYFVHSDALMTYNLESGTARRKAMMEKGAENLEIADNLNIAFTKEHNIFVFDPDKEKIIPITSDGTREITYGEAAHRFEFGITKGLFWSPEGDALAFYRMDQSMVTDYPIVSYADTPASYQPAKYPMAGGKSHHVTVGVYHLKNGKITYLKTGEPKEQYLTNISWSPDGKSIYVAVVNRDQNEMKLNQYDARKGDFVATLFTETDKEYVEPEHGPIFLDDKGKEFLWFSERDGYNHLYHYNADGTLIRNLTGGDWDVTEFLGFDDKQKTAFIMGTKESPLERHAYGITIKNGEMSLLTGDKGYHRVSVSKSGDYLIDAFTQLEVPRIIQIVNVKKEQAVIRLLEAENPLADYNIGETRLLTLTDVEGTDLYCRMILPPDFDDTRKYPAVVYVYGGPHVQLVTDSWMGGAQMFLNYLAQQGYVVFTLDNHGSGNRGIEFEQAVFRKLGTREIADQELGLNYLKQQSFVDSERVGVYGWSFGGYMTMSLMLRKPGLFKVGVAGGPVTSWNFYEVMYTERYMDTPEQNPDGYKEAALANYVNNLEGKLMIIHGQLDDTVVPQHTFSFIRKCVEEGVLVDYFPYPAHPHNVRGKDRVHLLKLISTYFAEHL